MDQYIEIEFFHDSFHLEKIVMPYLKCYLPLSRVEVAVAAIEVAVAAIEVASYSNEYHLN